MKDPVLQRAKDALDRLSADPEARMLAEQREMALISYHLDMTEARKQGLAEGEARGRAEGEARGRARAVLAVLEARQIPLNAEQRELIAACTDLAPVGPLARAGVDGERCR